jgi:hypothetical protein
MNTEINASRGIEEFPNPFKVANFFHWATVFSVAMVAMWLGVEATSATAEATPIESVVKMLSTIFLLIVAILHGAWAMKYSYFAIAPNNIGLLGGAHPDTPVDFMERLIVNGIPIKDPPKNTLANFLYRKVPNLRYVPELIRAYAFLHWVRSLMAAATLISFLAAMALTWKSPGQPAIALAYFIFISYWIARPTSGLVRLVRGSLDVPSKEYKASTRSSGTTMVILLMIAPLISRLVLRLYGDKLQAWDIAPVLTPIFCMVLLLASLLTGILSFMALVRQVKDLSGTRARLDEKTLGMFQADVQLPFTRLDSWMRSNLGEHSAYKLPTRRLFVLDPQVEKTSSNGAFKGSRLEESIPRASFGDPTDSFFEAFGNAWRSDRHRPLVLLDILGWMLIVAMLTTTVLLIKGVVDSQTGFITTYIIFVLGLFAAAEHAYSAAHQLWQRFEFVSEVVSVKFEGTYSNDTQVIRDQMSSDVGVLRVGSEYVSTLTLVRGASLKVSRFTIKSICFQIDEVRYPLDISARVDGNQEVIDIFDNAFNEYKQGREQILRDEARAKAAYSGNDQNRPNNSQPSLDQNQRTGLYQQYSNLILPKKDE